VLWRRFHGLAGGEGRAQVRECAYVPLWDWRAVWQSVHVSAGCSAASASASRVATPGASTSRRRRTGGAREGV
jgi:hypothetical protein